METNVICEVNMVQTSITCFTNDGSVIWKRRDWTGAWMVSDENKFLKRDSSQKLNTLKLRYSTY
jgi:hypothetical protein